MEKDLKKNAKTEAVEEKKAQKYTYEELNNICGQLYAQNQKLVQQLRQIDQVSMFKRMEYLLKIVELSDKINDAEFINYCIEDIKAGIILPEESKEETKEE